MYNHKIITLLAISLFLHVCFPKMVFVLASERQRPLNAHTQFTGASSSVASDHPSPLASDVLCSDDQSDLPNTARLIYKVAGLNIAIYTIHLDTTM